MTNRYAEQTIHSFPYAKLGLLIRIGKMNKNVMRLIAEWFCFYAAMGFLYYFIMLIRRRGKYLEGFMGLFYNKILLCY